MRHQLAKCNDLRRVIWITQCPPQVVRHVSIQADFCFLDQAHYTNSDNQFGYRSHPYLVVVIESCRTTVRISNKPHGEPPGDFAVVDDRYLQATDRRCHICAANEGVESIVGSAERR